MFSRFAMVVSAAALALPAWAVNKCTEPDGRVVFQDAPCQGVGEKLKIPGERKASDGSKSSDDLQTRFEQNMRILREQQEIADRPVSIGMTAEEVISTWGRPMKVNTTVTPGKRSEQWVYRRGRSRTQYVYLDNGVVRATQDSQ